MKNILTLLTAVMIVASAKADDCSDYTNDKSTCENAGCHYHDGNCGQTFVGI